MRYDSGTVRYAVRYTVTFGACWYPIRVRYRVTISVVANAGYEVHRHVISGDTRGIMTSLYWVISGIQLYWCWICFDELEIISFHISEIYSQTNCVVYLVAYN